MIKFNQMKNRDITAQELDSISDLGQLPTLNSQGSSNLEGYQIFTPGFIVNDMINLIGEKQISCIKNAILEPASGDGAFTTRILEKRLQSIFNDPEYYRKSLIALSTIFSIELDNDLIKMQRNNIFSLIMHYAKIRKEEITDEYIVLAKKIIITNFIWGETNIDSSLIYKGQPMGWYMPTLVKNKSMKSDNNRIRFARWTIQPRFNQSSFEYEEWEASDSVSDTSDYGGLFSDLYK